MEIYIQFFITSQLFNFQMYHTFVVFFHKVWWNTFSLRAALQSVESKLHSTFFARFARFPCSRTYINTTFIYTRY